MWPDADERNRSVVMEMRDLDPQEVSGSVALAESMTTGRSSDSEVSSGSIHRREFEDVVVCVVSASSALMTASRNGRWPRLPVDGERGGAVDTFCRCESVRRA